MISLLSEQVTEGQDKSCKKEQGSNLSAAVSVLSKLVPITPREGQGGCPDHACIYCPQKTLDTSPIKLR